MDTTYVGQVMFGLATEGADVVLVCECQQVRRKMIRTFPIRVRFTDPSERWQVRATKRGFVDYVEDIRFERGANEKTIVIRLEPKTEGAP
jgi:hypothetical protein